MSHELPALPYALDALEPVISAETLALHHGKHHKAYVDKLNDALAPHPDLQHRDIEDLLRDLTSLPLSVRQSVRNHGGGHHNHSLFWRTLRRGGAPPSTELAARLQSTFGGLQAFQEKFEREAGGFFGSGWTFLVFDPAKDAIDICSLPNQDSPLSAGRVPLMLCDLWEHAYYLQYKNQRAEWVKAWWKVVDWQAVHDNLRAASAGPR